MKKFVKNQFPSGKLLKFIVMVKMVWIFMLASALQVVAGNTKSYSQVTKLDLDLKNSSLESIIWTLKKQSEFNFFYNSDDVKGVEGISATFKNSRAEEILSTVLEGTGLTFDIVHKTVIIRKDYRIKPRTVETLELQKSQQKEISGKVTDANGLPLLDGSFQNKDYDVVIEQINADGTKSYINTQIESNVDPRLDFIIGRINVRWKTYEVEPVTEHWYRDFNAYGYHFIKRFLVSPEKDMFTGYPWGSSGLNYQIIRYANVLLWRAEALIELGRQEEARSLINQIRLRSKNSPYVTAWEDKEEFPTAIDINGYPAIYLINEYPASGWTQDYARQALRYETRIETALEGERFFDLVRWGIAEETMNNFFRCEEDNRVYYKNVKFTAGRDEYYPIPLTQYNLAKGVYVQNPGYGDF